MATSQITKTCPDCNGEGECHWIGGYGYGPVDCSAECDCCDGTGEVTDEIGEEVIGFLLDEFTLDLEPCHYEWAAQNAEILKQHNVTASLPAL